MKHSQTTGLVADALKADPEVQSTLATLLQRIDVYRQQISGIRPPQTALKESYAKAIQSSAHVRGVPLWYPYLGSGMGNGVLVELADGSVKYDCISGIGVHIGHCHPKIIQACLEAALQDIAMQGHLMQNVDAAALSAKLAHLAGLDHCMLSTSGAMAVENGLKLIFQSRAPANRILAFDHCFMGRTLALAQITDKPSYREGLPINGFVDYVPFYEWSDPEGSTARAVAALKKHLNRYPGQHACMCMELIQGENGYYPGTREFFLALIKVLKEHAVLLLVDEIQTFARLDRLFAFQHFGLDEYVDVVTAGKVLHACATIYRRTLAPKAGLISQTVLSPTSAIRCAHVILDSLTNEGYLGPDGKNMRLARYFVEHLQAIAARYPDLLEGPYGLGLLIACTPLKGERKSVLRLANALFEAGLISFIGGTHPMRLRFLFPAGSITEKDLDHISTLFEATLLHVAGELK